MSYDPRYNRQDIEADLLRLAHRLLCRLFIDGHDIYRYTKRGRTFTVVDDLGFEVFTITPRLKEKRDHFEVRLTGSVPFLPRLMRMADLVEPLILPRPERPRSVMGKATAHALQ